MKAFGGGTRFGWFSYLVARAIGLSFILLGLSIGIGGAQTTPTAQPGEHVYLLRGAFNVFSLGMDQIAAKLRQHGVHASVDNYLAWPSLAEQAAAEYKNGRARTIILVGHSSGATAVTSMATRLSQLGVPVKLAIGLDPTSRLTTTGHIDRYVNYYIANGFGDPVDKGKDFSGVLQNVDLEYMANVSHFNIDKNNMLQSMVIRDILAAVSSGAPHVASACGLPGGKGCGSTNRGAVVEGKVGTAGR
jgi:predicted esterase